MAAVPTKIVRAPSPTRARTQMISVRSRGGARWRDAQPARDLRRAGSPHERHRGDENQHREREVAHHPAIVERTLDREAAEHRLTDHSQRQQGREPRQVAPIRAAAKRQHPRSPCRDRDRNGDQPVGELDHRVGVQRGVDVAVALGPGGAAKAGPGQAHGGPGEDDQGQGPQRDVGDVEVLGRRDRVTVGALAQALETGAHLLKDAH